MAESEEESLQAEHRVQPSAEGHCSYPLYLNSSCQAPCSSMTPCAAVAQGIFCTLVKRI